MNEKLNSVATAINRYGHEEACILSHELLPYYEMHSGPIDKAPMNLLPLMWRSSSAIGEYRAVATLLRRYLNDQRGK